MKTETESNGPKPRTLDAQVVGWRCKHLQVAGFPRELADELAGDDRVDLHALIELVERGCEPRLAVRILAPLKPERDARCRSGSVHERSHEHSNRR